MICPLLEEVEQVKELELIAKYIADSCQKGKEAGLSRWTRNVLVVKWLKGDEMSKSPGFEESGKTVRDHALAILRRAEAVIR